MSLLKTKTTGMSLPTKSVTAGGVGGGSEVAGWEMRPCGMLVQKRTSDSNQSPVTVPTIKVRVKYGSSYHEVNISSQASFGELKKMLAGQTGLHPQDQKLIYKDKERDSKVFLDFVGVKNGSKLVLVEDEISRERRYLESRKNAKMEKASKEIAAIKSEVDKLAKQVASAESQVCSGKKVLETVLLNLIELLMTQLIKLDAITADGDVKEQRKLQVKRVQKYIETVDMLEKRNSAIVSNGIKLPLQQQHKIFTGQGPIPFNYQTEQRKQRTLTGERIPGRVVVTTKWETF